MVSVLENEKSALRLGLSFPAKKFFWGPLGSWTSAPSGQGRPRKKRIFSSTPSDGVNMERKKPIKKNHIKEFGGRDARRRPRDKLGTSQGHLGHLGLIYV